MPEQGPAPPAQPTQALPASTPPAPAPEAQAGVHSVQAVLALLQQASQAPPVPAQEQVQMLLLQAMQAQAVQAQVQQQLDLLQQQQQQQVLPRHQPAAQFSLQFQPPPSLPQQQQQQQQQQQPQAQAFLQGMGSRPLAHSGATSGGGSGSRGDSGARRPYPAALGPQMLAAAESLGTLSAGGGSRRSASRSVVQEEADAAAAEAAKRRGGPGIATDEELDQLHVHLAGQQVGGVVLRVAERRGAAAVCSMPVACWSPAGSLRRIPSQQGKFRSWRLAEQRLCGSLQDDAKRRRLESQ